MKRQEIDITGQLKEVILNGGVVVYRNQGKHAITVVVQLSKADAEKEGFKFVSFHEMFTSNDLYLASYYNTTKREVIKTESAEYYGREVHADEMAKREEFNKEIAEAIAADPLPGEEEQPGEKSTILDQFAATLKGADADSFLLDTEHDGHLEEAIKRSQADTLNKIGDLLEELIYNQNESK